MKKINSLLVCFLLFVVGVANSSERTLKFTGTLQTVISDDFKNNSSETEYYLDILQADQTHKTVKLNFPKKSEPHVRGKTEVELTGFYNKESIFEITDWNIIHEESSAESITPDIRKVLYVSLNLADAQVIETPDQLKAAITKTSAWMQEGTFDKIEMPTDPNGDGQIDLVSVNIANTTASGCQAQAWANVAINQLNTMGVNTAFYQHIFFFLPPANLTQCNWSGQGLESCGNSCRAWSEANLSSETHVHEFGHNLGLHHAATDTNDDLATEYEYGDGTCPMGNIITSGYYNAPHQAALNWLSEAAGDIAPITKNGSYSLKPMSQLPLGGTRVYVADRDTAHDYYISYRPQTDFEILGWGYGLNIYSIAKDFTGFSSWITTLFPGQSWVGNSLRIDVGNLNADGTMQFNALTNCFQNPILVMNPQYNNVNASTPAKYILSIKNPQAAGCPPLNVTLTSKVPNTLALKIPHPTFVLKPGTTKTENLVLSTTSTTNGWTSFSVSAAATNNSTTYKGFADTLNRVFIGNTLPALEAGVNMYHYSGFFNRLPDFTNMTPDHTSVSPQVRMSAYNGQNNYALRFEGLIQIRTSGTHTFYLNSDDGSRLFINGIQIINNDGMHGGAEVSGTMSLTPGFYPIVIDYTQTVGGYGLTFSHSDPGGTKIEVPETDLFHYGLQ